VSPPDKNGGDVLVDVQRTRAATDGDAVAFASLTAFAGAQGTGLATDYLAQRVGDGTGTNGWSVKPMTPLQGALSLPFITSAGDAMDVAFTDDLDTSVFLSQAPLTPDPFVSGVPNLYIRTGLRSSASPANLLVTACPVCAATSTPLPPFTLVRGVMVPHVASVSADGRSVLFESTLKLTSDATDGTATGTVNVYLSRDGAVQDVGVLPGGTTAPNAVAGQGALAGQLLYSYMSSALSSDGTKAEFTADPAICNVSAGTYTCGTLYLRDTSATPETTVQVNASEKSPPGTAQPALFWFMSADGSRVLFTSIEALTAAAPADGSVKLYAFDATAPAGRRLTYIGRADSVLGASDDGRTVYFASPIVTPVKGGIDTIYRWSDADGGAPVVRFVAPLNDSVAMTREDRMTGNIITLGQPRQSRVSPDGQFLLFSESDGRGVLSDHGGTDYDQGNCNDLGAPGCRELYLYNSASDTIHCVSCRPDGAPATADATDYVAGLSGAAQHATYANRPLTDDGRVFFTTAEPLVPGDTNGFKDAYEWENGQVHLLTDGTSPGDSYFLDATPDGRDVFVVTRARLSPWDTDTSYDLYDVRQPGAGHPAGISGPLAPPGSGCTGDGCRGSVSPAPGAPQSATTAFTGPGNPAPGHARPGPPRCKAGTVRKPTRHGATCVKRRKTPKRRVHHRPRRAR
jgi:hypothetical protein